MVKNSIETIEAQLTEPSSLRVDLTAPAEPRLIDEMIASTADWRGAAFSDLRRIIHEADPNIVEGLKWKRPGNPAGVPVFEHAGIVCTGALLEGRVRITFASGARLADPVTLFNVALENDEIRAIDFYECCPVDEQALKALVLAGVQYNLAQTGQTAG